MSSTSIFLVIGDTAVARRLCATVTAERGAHRVRHLVRPRDADLASALAEPVDHAAVLIHDDVAALRYALALSHLDPDLALAVTIFDRTIATQLQKLLPTAIVASTAWAAAPCLLGPCLETDVVAAFRDGPHRVDLTANDAGELVETRQVVRPPGLMQRIVGALMMDHRHQSPGTRILLKGLVGLG